MFVFVIGCLCWGWGGNVVFVVDGYSGGDGDGWLFTILIGYMLFLILLLILLLLLLLIPPPITPP